MEKRAKKVLREEFEETEVKRESCDKRTERESFIITLKKDASLSRDDEEDISESVVLKSLKMNIDFK